MLRYPAVNLELARCLERAEGLASAAYIQSRQRAQPSRGAATLLVAGVYALFDHPASPLTQSFGLGLTEPAAQSAWEALESHFESRGANVAHEVSSFTHPETWSQLSERGYSPNEASTVLVRPTAGALPRSADGPLRVRRAESEERVTWCRVMSEGLASDSPELEATVADLAPVMADALGSHCFIAFWDGEPIAAGLLNLQEGVAVLGGACTLPWARRRGAQAALLAARLELAASNGIQTAMVVAGPGSGSQRNAERQGFRPVYTRSKWQRDQRAALASR